MDQTERLLSNGLNRNWGSSFRREPRIRPRPHLSSCCRVSPESLGPSNRISVVLREDDCTPSSHALASSQQFIHPPFDAFSMVFLF
ncbi:hypothetical protein I7I50_04181 [Histoplasma capsulatum G186AR]|uniref:Uncharacterized protein n=1 Tax=Ajellomyces capsulatus TaxID=5037 RepID=A0A8H8CXT8_AJECA|nr:hypothetical protein I7I52_05089 [Histoplasma capsulatum]QSS75139.1 hypothetical protein I7I50_04181 [Histoplasma capsulatum G186AR]